MEKNTQKIRYDSNGRTYSTTREEYIDRDVTRCGTACKLWTVLGALLALAAIMYAYSLGVEKGYKDAYPIIANEVRGQNVGVQPMQDRAIPTVEQQVQSGVTAIASGAQAVGNAVVSGATQAANTVASGASAVVGTAEQAADVVSMDGIKLKNGYVVLSKFAGDAALWELKTGNALGASTFNVIDVDNPYVLLETVTAPAKKYEVLKYNSLDGKFTQIWSGTALPTTPEICNSFREANKMNKSFDLFANCQF